MFSQSPYAHLDEHASVCCGEDRGVTGSARVKEETLVEAISSFARIHACISNSHIQQRASAYASAQSTCAYLEAFTVFLEASGILVAAAPHVLPRTSDPA